MKINTNFQSQMVQKNLSKSTASRNTAVERMTTGSKINRASDDAANYSISNNYSSKLSSYNVASDNISSGLALLATAQDTISMMQDKASRIQSLITQARNCNYGSSSLEALTQEAGVLVSDIQNLYNRTEYNGINLFDYYIPKWAQEVEASAGTTYEHKTIAEMTAANNGFLAEIETVTPDIVVENAEDLATAIANNSVIGIANGAVLKKLSELGASGNICSGKTIVLTDDIDLSAYQAGTGWTSISNFKGVFDGQGHKITGLKINNGASRGLFSGLDGSSVVVKNLGIEGANVKVGSNGGILTGTANNSPTIKNCYTTGTFNETYASGGCIVGRGTCKIEDCYSTANITGGLETGGIIGNEFGGQLINCHYEGNMLTNGNGIGGIIGQHRSAKVSKCSVRGTISGTATVGGLIGIFNGENGGTVDECYVEADVKGTNRVGGVAGVIWGNGGKIINSEFKGAVKGTEYMVGGFVGRVQNATEIQNCFADVDIIGGGMRVGGFIGNVSVNNNQNAIIKNCYSKGTVNGSSKFNGGFIGTIEHLSDTQTTKIENCLSYSVVNSENSASGSFIGGIINAEGTAETRLNKISITNCLTNFSKEGMSTISGWYLTTGDTEPQEYDLSKWTNNIQVVTPNKTTLQTGITDGEASSISFDTSFKFDLSGVLSNISGDNAYNIVNDFMDMLSQKSTELGAASNRLESALESTSVNIMNLASSRSTIKDADISKVSSQYIRQQILLEASSTLLSTANQSSEMTIQLINSL